MSSGRSGIVHIGGLGRHEWTGEKSKEGGDAKVAKSAAPKKQRDASLAAFLKTKKTPDPAVKKAARQSRRAQRKAERAEAHLKRVHAGLACRLQKIVNPAPKPKVMVAEKRTRTPQEENRAQLRRRRQWVRLALNYLLRGRMPPRIPEWWGRDDIRRASVEAAFS